MKTIWKVQLRISDEQRVGLPKGAVPLSAQMQNGVLCAWFAVDTFEPTRDLVVFVRGTGHPMREAAGARFVGTAQDGELVWHVFASQE